MNNQSEFDLDAIFALLPDDLTAEAKARTLDLSKNSRSDDNLILPWSDFTRDGTFLRGGLTDLTSLSVSFVSSSQTDQFVHTMANLARNGQALPGGIVPTDPDRFVWFLPLGPGSASLSTGQSIRGLSINQAHFGWALDRFSQSIKLTTAEKRILFQLVQGCTPREAAAIDHVSFETKRAQIKTASSKLRCSGQSDLIRHTLGQLISVFNASTTEATGSVVAEEFITEHLAEDASFVRHLLMNGRQVDVITCGPVDGRPVVVVHGMMFLILLKGCRPHLERHGLRLIIPVRSGFLDPFASLDPSKNPDHCDRFFFDIRAFLDQNDQFRGSPLLGHSFGAALAVRLAANDPSRFSSLILASTKLGTAPAERNRISDQFYDGMHRLVRNRRLSRHVTEVFRTYYSMPETGTRILLELFKDSESDRGVICGDAKTPPVISWFADLYGSSIHGITDDFCFDMNGWWQCLHKLKQPVHVIHGDGDPLTSQASLDRIQSTVSSASTTIIEKGGHFIAASHRQEFWDAIAKRLT